MTAKIDVNDLLARVSELPPMPQVAQRALGLIRNPKSNMTDFSFQISVHLRPMEMILCARCEYIKIPNSLYEGDRNLLSGWTVWGWVVVSA